MGNESLVAECRKGSGTLALNLLAVETIKTPRTYPILGLCSPVSENDGPAPF